MAIDKFDGIAPQFGAGAWVHDSAQVIGDVSLGGLGPIASKYGIIVGQ